LERPWASGGLQPPLTTLVARMTASLLLAINLYSHSMISAAFTFSRDAVLSAPRDLHPNELLLMLEAEECYRKSLAIRTTYVGVALTPKPEAVASRPCRDPNRALP